MAAINAETLLLKFVFTVARTCSALISAPVPRALMRARPGTPKMSDTTLVSFTLAS
jgi:hypothetical protein